VNEVITGVGVLPAVTLSPTSLSFPTQIVFTNSKVQTATLNNTGLGYLYITNIAATGPFTQTNNCGSTVNPGSSCTLTVTFRPTKAGSVTGALSITDNAPLSPQRVSLKGTGTYVQLTPASLKSGNQPVGTKSLPKKITLSNKGSVAVNITQDFPHGSQRRRLCPDKHLRQERGGRGKLLYHGNLHAFSHGQANGNRFQF
jgi:hypothetical protein